MYVIEPEEASIGGETWPIKKFISISKLCSLFPRTNISISFFFIFECKSILSVRVPSDNKNTLFVRACLRQAWLRV